MMSAAIGIIGGSGVSGFEGLEDVEERRVETPFGDFRGFVVVFWFRPGGCR